MPFAAITGWGKCLPPAVLSNQDLSTFLDVDDEWIVKRTGMKERRISHVPTSVLAYVAASRALAGAGASPEDVDLIILGTTTPDKLCPNIASNVQRLLGANRAGCMDLNTACTSFLYALSAASAMIRTGSIRKALVIGAEVVSTIMDWEDRNVAILFGDGAAAFFLEAGDSEQGLLAEALGCDAGARDSLTVHGWGLAYMNKGIPNGLTAWQFEGRDIFKKAVRSMVSANEKVLEKAGMTMADMDLVVPHQANLRIINTMAEHGGIPMEKVFINIHRYGNMSAATIPVALTEAIESGRVRSGSRILIPAFGAGLSWSSHILKWGERLRPLEASSVNLPPCSKTGLELVSKMRSRKNEAAEGHPDFRQAWAEDGDLPD